MKKPNATIFNSRHSVRSDIDRKDSSDILTHSYINFSAR